MALKGMKPTAAAKRLKLFMYGDAGVGKTTAACQMPKPYIIDSEHGSDNYSETINFVRGAVFHTVDIDEVIQEVRSLSVEDHDYRTLVIDPITPLYFDLVDKCEERVGSDWGRHYGEANKYMKRLINLLMRLDMNVVITAHAKAVYGDEMKKTGITFDGWKRLDYIFDLVLELRRSTPTKRHARIVKTRMETFPDGDSFEWSYKELVGRFSVNEMEREAESLVIADAAQIQKIVSLAANMVNGDTFIDKCVRKAKVDELSDLTGEQAEAMIEHLKTKLGVCV